MTGDMVSSASLSRRGVAVMKTIVSALIALSVLASIAAPASAAKLDAKAFWEQLDRQAQ
jgi:hypothetical protein